MVASASAADQAASAAVESDAAASPWRPDGERIVTPVDPAAEAALDEWPAGHPPEVGAAVPLGTSILVESDDGDSGVMCNLGDVEEPPALSEEVRRQLAELLPDRHALRLRLPADGAAEGSVLHLRLTQGMQRYDQAVPLQVSHGVVRVTLGEGAFWHERQLAYASRLRAVLVQPAQGGGVIRQRLGERSVSFRSGPQGEPPQPLFFTRDEAERYAPYGVFSRAERERLAAQGSLPSVDPQDVEVMEVSDVQ